MSFWEPTEWFDKLVDLESGIDDATWNSASQDERERMLEPVIDEYIRTYGDSTDWEKFFDDLEDNNFHTECRMFRECIAKRNGRRMKERDAFLAGFEAGRKAAKKAMRKRAMPWQRHVPEITDREEWIYIGDNWVESYAWECGDRCFNIADLDDLGWVWVEYPFNIAKLEDGLNDGNVNVEISDYRHELGFQSKEEAWRSLADWWNSNSQHRHTTAKLIRRR